MPITRQDGTRAERLGLNVPEIARVLRRHAFPEAPTGAAHVRWPEKLALPVEGLGTVFGVLVLARQSVRSDQSVWVESGASLHVVVLPASGDPRPIEGVTKGQLIRGLVDATARRDPEQAPELIERLAREEGRLLGELRRPTDTDRSQRISHAVVPLFAGVVAVGKAAAGGPSEAALDDEQVGPDERVGERGCPTCGSANDPFEVVVGGVRRLHCEECRP